MIDAHHHLWDLGRRAYPWLAGDAHTPIRRTYTRDDLRRHVEASGVDRTVLVQTVSDRGETAEFLATARESDGLIAGVVGWVDLTSDVAEQLAVLRAGPGGDGLVGIRHQAQDEDDPRWLLRPDVLRGLRAVGRADLAYDLLVPAPQLDVARQLARALPDVRFVLDHAAKPPIASGETQPWAGELRRLAELDNVVCKLSGLVTEARWDSWDAAAIAPYAEVVLDAFGPERVMFGSDWPVCELAGSYGDVVALARELTSTLSASEAALVFDGTARHVYRLA